MNMPGLTHLYMTGREAAPFIWEMCTITLWLIDARSIECKTVYMQSNYLGHTEINVVDINSGLKLISVSHEFYYWSYLNHKSCWFKLKMQDVLNTSACDYVIAVEYKMKSLGKYCIRILF